MDGLIVALVIAAFAFFSSLSAKNQKNESSNKNTPYTPSSKQKNGEPVAFRPSYSSKKAEVSRDDVMNKIGGFLKTIVNEDTPAFDMLSPYLPQSQNSPQRPPHSFEVVEEAAIKESEENRRLKIIDKIEKESEAVIEKKKRHQEQDVTSSDKSPLVFSEDPIVQGMIMSEIFTRPCDRKRGFR